MLPHAAWRGVVEVGEVEWGWAGWGGLSWGEGWKKRARTSRSNDPMTVGYEALCNSAFLEDNLSSTLVK